jgi:hypothetical protein
VRAVEAFNEAESSCCETDYSSELRLFGTYAIAQMNTMTSTTRWFGSSVRPRRTTPKIDRTKTVRITTTRRIVFLSQIERRAD